MTMLKLAHLIIDDISPDEISAIKRLSNKNIVTKPTADEIWGKMQIKSA